MMFVGIVMLGLFGFGTSGYAHGYVTSPGVVPISVQHLQVI